VKAKLKVWVVFDRRVKFGDGRAELLALIDRLGSIQRAVARMNMSYRSAWGYLRDLERSAGFKFLERRPGAAPGGGTRLTARGRAFLARYRRFRAALDPLVQRRFDRIFVRGRRSRRG
jgi:molybdate transport system regulatory protein